MDELNMFYLIKWLAFLKNRNKECTINNRRHDKSSGKN